MQPDVTSMGSSTSVATGETPPGSFFIAKPVGGTGRIDSGWRANLEAVLSYADPAIFHLKNSPDYRFSVSVAIQLLLFW